MKEAEEELAGTVTEAGTVNPVSPEAVRATEAPPLGAAPERLTEQEVLLLELRLVELHCREEMVTGATREMVTAWEDPL